MHDLVLTADRQYNQCVVVDIDIFIMSTLRRIYCRVRLGKNVKISQYLMGLRSYKICLLALLYFWLYLWRYSFMSFQFES